MPSIPWVLSPDRCFDPEIAHTLDDSISDLPILGRTAMSATYLRFAHRHGLPAARPAQRQSRKPPPALGQRMTHDTSRPPPL
jgi:hypothetical protein